jgi:fluoride exporter
VSTRAVGEPAPADRIAGMTAVGVEDPGRVRLPRSGVVLLLVVAVGGALGAVLRHGVDVAFPVDPLGLPWPTLGINLTGSAALAGLTVLPVVQRRDVVRVLLGPGVLGGFTTFSAYAEQGRRLLDGGMTGLALAYLLGTLAACLLGCVVGRLAATAVVRRGGSVPGSVPGRAPGQAPGRAPGRGRAR